MSIYLRFALYIIIYPFWRFSPARWMCGAAAGTFAFGGCRFIGSSRYLDVCKEALSMLESVDPELFSSLKSNDITIIESSIPKDFLCKRFGIESCAVDEGAESVFAEIIRVCFLTKYKTYSIREFYYEDEAPSTWKQGAWLEDLKRDI